MNAVSGWVQSYETLDKSPLACHSFTQQHPLQSDQHLVSLHNGIQHRQQSLQHGCAFYLPTDTPYIEPTLWQQLNIAATTTMSPVNLNENSALLTTTPSILIKESPPQHYEPRYGNSRIPTPVADDNLIVPSSDLGPMTAQQQPVLEGATYLTCPASLPSPLSSFVDSTAKMPLMPSMSVTDDHCQSSTSTTYSWPSFCNTSRIASPSVCSTPSLSAPSIYAITPSPSPALTVSSPPSTFQRPSIPLSHCSNSSPFGHLGNNNDGTVHSSVFSDQRSVTTDRNLLGSPLSTLERPKPQWLRQELSLLPSPSSSPPSHSPQLVESTSALVKTPPSSPRVCHICRKQYANNSTLRRHHKIHAYAHSNARALAMFRTASAFATGPTTVHSPHSLHSFPQRLLGSDPSILSLGNGRRQGWDTHPMSASTPTAPRIAPMTMTMTIPTGYNLRSDPAMKRPECVGCNKPFARRDTVILHIKNQKRKWDLLCSLLPTLYEAAAASTSLTQHKDPECHRALPCNNMKGAGNHSSPGGGSIIKAKLASPWEGPLSAGAASTATTLSSSPAVVMPRSSTQDPPSIMGCHKPQKQRQSHPHRVVERLWQSTLQKQMFHLGSNGTSSATSQSKQGDASLIATATLHGLEGKVENQKEMMVGINNRTTSGENENSIPPECGDGDGKGWLDLGGTTQLDTQAKLNWMMTVMEEPPCWKERKVRMFGAFGILEQKVLGSSCHE